MSVRAATEKNFRRTQVRPGKRKVRARLWWRSARAMTCVLLGGYVVVRACNLVVHAPGLQVGHILVHGNVRLSAGEVQALVDGLGGSSILTADLALYRRRLVESPWVADVAMRRILPSTVEIFIAERRPIGVCRLGSQLYLVDGHGTLIDEFGPRYAEFDLPIVDGLVRAPSVGAPVIDEVRARLAARLIDAVASRRDLAGHLSQVDVSDVHDVVVLLDGDSALLHVGEERFLERLSAYVDLAPTLRSRVRDIEYVDLRFDERVYVRPARHGG